MVSSVSSSFSKSNSKSVSKDQQKQKQIIQSKEGEKVLEVIDNSKRPSINIGINCIGIDINLHFPEIKDIENPPVNGNILLNNIIVNISKEENLELKFALDQLQSSLNDSIPIIQTKEVDFFKGLYRQNTNNKILILSFDDINIYGNSGFTNGLSYLISPESNNTLTVTHHKSSNNNSDTKKKINEKNKNTSSNNNPFYIYIHTNTTNVLVPYQYSYNFNDCFSLHFKQFSFSSSPQNEVFINDYINNITYEEGLNFYEIELYGITTDKNEYNFEYYNNNSESTYKIIQSLDMHLVNSKLSFTPITITLPSFLVKQLMTSIDVVLKTISLFRKQKDPNQIPEPKPIQTTKSEFVIDIQSVNGVLIVNENDRVEILIDQFKYNSISDINQSQTIIQANNIIGKYYENNNELYNLLSFDSNNNNESNTFTLTMTTIKTNNDINNISIDSESSMSMNVPHIIINLRLRDLLDIIHLFTQKKPIYPYPLRKTIPLENNNNIQQIKTPYNIKIFDIQLKCKVFEEMDKPPILVSLTSNVLYNRHYICSLEALDNKEVKPDLVEDISVILLLGIDVFKSLNSDIFYTLINPLNLQFTGSIHQSSVDFSIETEHIQLNVLKNTFLPVVGLIQSIIKPKQEENPIKENPKEKSSQSQVDEKYYTIPFTSFNYNENKGLQPLQYNILTHTLDEYDDINKCYGLEWKFQSDCILSNLIYNAADGIPSILLKCDLYYFNNMIGDYVSIYSFKIDLSQTHIFMIPLLNSENKSIDSLPLFPSSLWRLEYHILSVISNLNDSTITQINNILQRQIVFKYLITNFNDHLLNLTVNLKNITLNVSDICNTGENNNNENHDKIVNKYVFKEFNTNLYKYNNIFSLLINSEIMLSCCYRNSNMYYSAIKPSHIAFLYQKANSSYNNNQNMLLSLSNSTLNVLPETIYYCSHPIIGIINNIKGNSTHNNPTVLIQNYTSNTLYFGECHSNLIQTLLPYNSGSYKSTKTSIFESHSKIHFTLSPPSSSSSSKTDNYCEYWCEAIEFHEGVTTLYMNPPNSYEELRNICEKKDKKCVYHLYQVEKNGCYVLSVYPSCFITNCFDTKCNVKIYYDENSKEMSINENEKHPFILPNMENENVKYYIEIQPILQNELFEYSSKYSLVFADNQTTFIKIASTRSKKEFLLLLEVKKYNPVENMESVVWNIILKPIVEIDSTHFDWRLLYDSELFYSTSNGDIVYYYYCYYL